MRLGLFTLPFNDQPLEEVLEVAAKIGYQAVEISGHKDSRHLDLDAVLAGDKSVKKKVASRHLQISAISNHFEGMLIMGPHDETTDAWAPGPDPETKIKFGTQRMIKTAQVASELEVPVVVGFVGSSVWGKWYSFPPKNETVYEKAWGTFAERWNPILDKFREYGVKFALEVMASQMAYNIETSARAIKALGDRPEFGFNFEPAHLMWQSIDPVVFIKKFKERIYHCHAKDGETQPEEVMSSGVAPNGAWIRPDRGFRFRTPGYGDSRWPRIISALTEAGYDHVLSYEHEDPIITRREGAEKCYHFLAPLLIKEPFRGTSIFSFE